MNEACKLRMSKRTALCGMGAVLTASVLILAHSFASLVAADDAYDIIDDQPTRIGGPWYRGSAGDGHGSNNFVYTYVRGATNARGTPINSNSRARWTFTSVPKGSCEVYVYVPSDRATGDATYHFYENQFGNYTKFARLDQGDHEGWTRLTTLEAEGGEVRIYLTNDSSHGQAVSIDSRGYLHNRIAADAMRVRCEPRKSADLSIEISWMSHDIAQHVIRQIQICEPILDVSCEPLLIRISSTFDSLDRWLQDPDKSRTVDCMFDGRRVSTERLGDLEEITALGQSAYITLCMGHLVWSDWEGPPFKRVHVEIDDIKSNDLSPPNILSPR